MTVRDAYNFFCTLVLLAAVLGAIVWCTEPKVGNTYPTPPAGYQRCIADGHIEFCPKGTP